MDDNEIVSLYKLRSEKAISETEKKYGRYCYSIAYNILSSHSESSECVNDTYFKVWNIIPPTIPHFLQAFLGKVTRNIALHMYEKKKRKKRGAGETELALEELMECVDMRCDVEAESERCELEKAIADFLEQLEKSKRIVFVLRYWYLIPVKEIAVKQDISESQAKVMLYRIRKELKIFLKQRNLY